jgi:hypothetical protein
LIFEKTYTNVWTISRPFTGGDLIFSMGHGWLGGAAARPLDEQQSAAFSGTEHG